MEVLNETSGGQILLRSNTTAATSQFFTSDSKPSEKLKRNLTLSAAVGVINSEPISADSSHAAISVFECEPGVKILYEGVKYLWKNRITMDVCIFKHINSELATIEIISFNPKTSTEAPRLYCPYNSVLEKIDPEEINSKVTEKKEMYLRQKKVFNHDDIFNEVSTELLVKYIMARICEVENSTEFQINLSSMVGDKASENDPNKLEMLCPRPNTLKPQKITFLHNSTTKNFESTMTKWREEWNVLNEHNKTAATALQSQSIVLDSLEKHRMEVQEMRADRGALRQKWKICIKRVLFKARVAKMRARLSSVAEEALMARALQDTIQVFKSSRPRPSPLATPLPRSRQGSHQDSHSNANNIEDTVTVPSIPLQARKPSTPRSIRNSYSNGAVDTLTLPRIDSNNADNRPLRVSISKARSPGPAPRPNSSKAPNISKNHTKGRIFSGYRSSNSNTLNTPKASVTSEVHDALTSSQEETTDESYGDLAALPYFNFM